jgi:RimJ/RimL family protein N-acetyltransferase
VGEQIKNPTEELIQMIQELSYAQAPALAHLFTYTGDTLIKSYVQGHMGRGWADHLPNPTCGMITVGDFTFLAGDGGCPAARELVAAIKPFALVIPQDDAWGALIREIHGAKATRFTRYAIKKEPDVFDRARLERFVAALPPGYTLRQIDEELYARCMKTPFTGDFCSNFADAADYAARGLGFCVMAGDEIIGGASSYTFYTEGIEIEIAIREDHRRRGLATAVAARLILTCLDRGLYPSWDAANKSSLALAEKLGYHFDCEYDTYVIREGETT